MEMVDNQFCYLLRELLHMSSLNSHPNNNATYLYSGDKGISSLSISVEMPLFQSQKCIRCQMYPYRHIE